MADGADVPDGQPGTDQPARLPGPLPFGQFPHAIASDTRRFSPTDPDHRLTPTDRLVAMALLYWAFDSDRCTADWRIGTTSE